MSIIDFCREGQDESYALRLGRLKKSVSWAYDRSAFYKKRFDEAGVHPDDIGSLCDIRRLPFTGAADILQNSPHEFLTLPFSAVSRVSMNGGIIRAYTADEVAANISLTARALASAGVSRASVVGVAGKGTAARYASEAAEVLGAAVVSIDESDEDAQRLMETASPDTLIGTAEELTRILLKASPKKTGVRQAICLVEELPPPKISSLLTSFLFAPLTRFLFAPPLTGAPGAVYQCAVGSWHISEDCFLAELVTTDGGLGEACASWRYAVTETPSSEADESGEPGSSWRYAVTETPSSGANETGAARRYDMTKTQKSEAGESGELVMTSLFRAAMPVIRYRTGIFMSVERGICECGADFARISGFVNR